MADRIKVMVPTCTSCQRLAVGFVRWKKWLREPGPWSPKCDQHVPWGNAAAEVVGIRIVQDREGGGL